MAPRRNARRTSRGRNVKKEVEVMSPPIHPKLQEILELSVSSDCRTLKAAKAIKLYGEYLVDVISQNKKMVAPENSYIILEEAFGKIGIGGDDYDVITDDDFVMTLAHQINKMKATDLSQYSLKAQKLFSAIKGNFGCQEAAVHTLVETLTGEILPPYTGENDEEE